VITRKTLWMTVVVSLLVGGIAGFAIDRIYFQPTDSHFGKTRFVTFMTEELGLSKTQQMKLDSIITSVHPKFQAIRKNFKTSMQSQIDSTQRMIRAILTAEQQAKLDTLNKKMQGENDNQ
jgi:hypothetical protein